MNADGQGSTGSAVPGTATGTSHADNPAKPGNGDVSEENGGGKANTGSWGRNVARWAALLGLLALVGGLIYVSVPDFNAQLFSQKPPPGNCPRSGSSRGVSAGPPVRGATTAKLLSGQRSVAFGRSLTSRTLTAYLSLAAIPKGPAYFHVRTNPFVRSDDAGLNPQDIVASARSTGGTLILSVCFIRDGSRAANLGDPGSYAGSVTIDDNRLKAPVSVPVTVTMQYTNGTFLLWLYFGAILPGAWCVWVLRSKRPGDKYALSTAFPKWLLQVDGLVALVAGSIAAFAVYVGIYLRDPTWGSSALQPLTLYGGMFSAFVTTSGLASLSGHKG